MVDWLKMMVANKRSEEVVDPKLENFKPSRSALKRALLTALRCVDPDSEKRASMCEVVHMLESDEYPLSREVHFELLANIVNRFILLFMPSGFFNAYQVTKCKSCNIIGRSGSKSLEKSS